MFAGRILGLAPTKFTRASRRYVTKQTKSEVIFKTRACNFSSGKSGGEDGKAKDCSKINECVKKIFAELKKACLGGQARPSEQKPGSHGKDLCLEKSIMRLKQISPEAKPKKVETADKAKIPPERKETKKICSDPKKIEATDKTGPPPTAKETKEICSSATKDGAKRKEVDKAKPPPDSKETKKVCSRATPLPADTSKKETNATPPKQTKDHCRASKPCATQQKPKASEEVFADKRCVQDGDTGQSKSEVGGASQKTCSSRHDEDPCVAQHKKQLRKAESEKSATKPTNDRSYCGAKGKRDPCKKYREKWKQKAAADKKGGGGGKTRCGAAQSKADPFYEGVTKTETPCPAIKRNEQQNKGTCSSNSSRNYSTNNCLGSRNIERPPCWTDRSDELEDERYATVVQPWDPPYDIANLLGPLLDKTVEDEIDDYYGDAYANHMYYMYTPEFFYDVNVMLQTCRQAQPDVSKTLPIN